MCKCYHFWRENDNNCWLWKMIMIFCAIIYVIILGCYHLCYHLMLSFFTVSKCYHFYVIIFPGTYFVLSFDVIICCYHFPPFFFFLKTWHTRACPLFGNIGHSSHGQSSPPSCTRNYAVSHSHGQTFFTSFLKAD